MYFNWDREPNPDYMFKNCIYEDNYVLFSGLNDWLATFKVTNAFADVGGPNLQERCAVRDNVFFAASKSLVRIETYATEYLPDFEGNQYVQYAGNPVVSSESGDRNGVFFKQEDVRELLFDTTGTVTTLYSDWDTLGW